MGAGQPHLRIHAVNIFVRDQDASLRFYLDQLGFHLAFDAELHKGDRWVAVSPPDGSAVLALIAARPDSKEYDLIGRNTGVVFVTDDVTSKYLQWRKQGVRFDYTPRLRRVNYRSAKSDGERPVWGGVFTRFRDPDGNSFSLAGFDEVTREVEAQRRAMAEKAQAELRVAQELEIAKQVQARLFPQSQPQLKTLDYAGVCIQARQVGGDYYDFLDLGRNRLGLVIGDIAGKGIAAALLMANLQANLRSLTAIASADPERLLYSVNQLFHANTDDSAYATLFFSEYDDQTRRLRYANCGHLSALVLKADQGIDRLPSTTTVIGLFPEFECQVSERQLSPGDTLVLYTDGVTESFNEAGEEFGEDRLIEALRCHGSAPPTSLIDAIVQAVRAFSPHEQYDDITLIAAQCR